jgi:ribosomal-protein-alanine N-acetyltransferase
MFPVRSHIRWMINRDLEQILQIESDTFDFPWCSDDFLAALRKRNCIGMVAEDLDRETVAGYMLYELHPRRLQVVNFAVDSDVHRRRVGTAMVNKLKSKLTAARRSRIMLELRETNLPAQLFFRAVGFKCISLLCGFYPDSGEDGYLMQYRPGSPASGRQASTDDMRSWLIDRQR